MMVVGPPFTCTSLLTHCGQSIGCASSDHLPQASRFDRGMLMVKPSGCDTSAPMIIFPPTTLEWMVLPPTLSNCCLNRFWSLSTQYWTPLSHLSPFTTSRQPLPTPQPPPTALAPAPASSPHWFLPTPWCPGTPRQTTFPTHRHSLVPTPTWTTANQTSREIGNVRRHVCEGVRLRGRVMCMLNFWCAAILSAPPLSPHA